MLYDDAMRNDLFKVLILLSALGALLNLIPYCFYDLTENKHRAYVGVLKIRTMFENHSLGKLEKEELVEAMEIIREAQRYFGREKLSADKSMSRAQKREIKEINLAVERSAIIMQDLRKFSGEAGMARLAQAEKDFAKGEIYFYADAKEEMRVAKKLPKSTESEREIRSDAIKNARVKKESAALIAKYGTDNLTPPDEAVKEEIINRETHSFIESIKLRQELRAYLKAVSVYNRITKPYTDAKNLIGQAENYTRFDELEKMYAEVSAD